MTQQIRYAGLALLLLPISMACDPAALIDVETPSTVVEPGAVETPAGALGLYHQAVGTFAAEFGGGNSTPGGHIVLTGLMTDEMMYGTGGIFSGVDERINPDGGAFYVGTYHRPRVAAQRAREALRRYYPTAPQALLGRLHAIEGYVLTMFADAYCSGLPLTEVPLVGSPVFTKAYSTTEVLERAVAYFDSAIALSADSVRFVHLAKVGKGRALLNLGRFEEAQQAVQEVPQEFVFGVEYGTTGVQVNALGNVPRYIRITDREGGNGLVWSGDPRTVVVTTPDLSGAMPITGKYLITNGQVNPNAVSPTAPIRLADGLEAKLIAAESDLARGGTGWLETLRMLRETCIGSSPCAPVPGLTSTNLPSSELNDPGVPATRLDLLMKERAMWLFATGHRQGDLRRLARVYRRNPETLWPIGSYRSEGFPPFVDPHPSNGVAYGRQYVLNHGPDQNNPIYRGCIDLDP